MDELFELEKDRQMPTIFSLSTLENISIPEEYRYGSCK